MDPLSGVASVIAVIDVGSKVLKLCSQYYTTVKDAKDDIGRLKTAQTILQDILREVQQMPNEAENGHTSAVRGTSALQEVER